MRIQRPASAPDKPPARRSFKLRCTALPCRGRLHRRRIDAGRRGGRRGRRGGGGGGARRGGRESAVAPEPGYTQLSAAAALRRP